MLILIYTTAARRAAVVSKSVRLLCNLVDVSLPFVFVRSYCDIVGVSPLTTCVCLSVSQNQVQLTILIDDLKWWQSIKSRNPKNKHNDIKTKPKIKTTPKTKTTPQNKTTSKTKVTQKLRRRLYALTSISFTPADQKWRHLLRPHEFLKSFNWENCWFIDIYWYLNLAKHRRELASGGIAVMSESFCGIYLLELQFRTWWIFSTNWDRLWSLLADQTPGVGQHSRTSKQGKNRYSIVFGTTLHSWILNCGVRYSIVFGTTLHCWYNIKLWGQVLYCIVGQVNNKIMGWGTILYCDVMYNNNIATFTVYWS